VSISRSPIRATRSTLKPRKAGLIVGHFASTTSQLMPAWNTGFAKGQFATVTCPSWMMAEAVGAPDLEGATCDVSEAAGAPACAGAKLPAGAKQSLKKAGKLFAKVAGITDAAKRNKLLTSASKLLTKAGRAIDKAARRKKKPLPAACATALRALIADAQQRIQNLRT
jgi:hypothetical protein